MQTQLYNLDLSILFISFSNFMASPISPWIFNFPDMKADTAFNSPLNIFTKSSLSRVIVQLAPPGASPWPNFPDPVLRSINHTPSSGPKKLEIRFEITVKRFLL